MTCQKVPYVSKEEALKDIQIINVNRKWRSRRLGKNCKSGRKLYAYHCPRCGNWHLTTQRRRKKYISC